MLSDAARLGRGVESGGPCVVEKQERAQVALVLTAVGEERPDREAVANPMAAGSAIDTEDFLHGEPP
jgi:hypothetical protein